MATKTISITEDAYERLAARKEQSESFSDVIVKMTGKGSLMELAGVLTKNEAEELRANISARRAMMRARLKRVAKRLA